MILRPKIMSLIWTTIFLGALIQYPARLHAQSLDTPQKSAETESAQNNPTQAGILAPFINQIWATPSCRTPQITTLFSNSFALYISESSKFLDHIENTGRNKGYARIDIPSLQIFLKEGIRKKPVYDPKYVAMYEALSPLKRPEPKITNPDAITIALEYGEPADRSKSDPTSPALYHASFVPCKRTELPINSVLQESPFALFGALSDLDQTCIGVKITDSKRCASAAFQIFDIDGNNTLDQSELIAAYQTLAYYTSLCDCSIGEPYGAQSTKDSAPAAAALIKAADKNGDHMLSLTEMQQGWTSAAETDAFFNLNAYINGLAKTFPFIPYSDAYDIIEPANNKAQK